MLIIFLGFLAIVIENVVGALMSQASARNKAVLNGFLNTVRWPMNAFTIGIAIHASASTQPLAHYGYIASLVLGAGVGSATGTFIGSKWIPRGLVSPVRTVRRHLHTGDGTGSATPIAEWSLSGISPTDTRS